MERTCPDGGRCTHDCDECIHCQEPLDRDMAGEPTHVNYPDHHEPKPHGCWRVTYCGPLSAYGETWTAEHRAFNVNPPRRIEDYIVGAAEP